MLRKFGFGFGVIAIGLLLIYATMRAGWWNTDLESAKARQAGPPSQFVTVDGVPIHYRDEGRGPVLVLLHGSIVNLHEWDLVAARLKDRYRVVRLDWPPYGLSGPDPKGVYTTPRAAELVAGLVDQLGIQRFTLVSTSNGANVALEYARHHQDRLEGMAFSILPLERPSQTRHVAWHMKYLAKFHDNFLPDWRGRVFFRWMLQTTSPPTFQPEDWMIDSIYDADNLPGALARQRQYIASNTQAFKTTDVGAVAELIHVPVLLQWCGYDTVISQGLERTRARFTQAPVTVIEYPDVGHFPMWEIPDRFSADLAKWVQGLHTGT